MTSERFWDAAQSIITKTENHKFLTSMVDGSLSEEKFVYYVIQDALYLTDFADCLKYCIFNLIFDHVVENFPTK